jgi:hypothetical protein
MTLSDLIEKAKSVSEKATAGPFRFSNNNALHEWAVYGPPRKFLRANDPNHPLSDKTEHPYQLIKSRENAEAIVLWRSIAIPLLDVAQKIAAVKAAQHGPIFWQCDCGPLEDLDDSILALETALREAIHE